MVEVMKARFDDRVITTRAVQLSDGRVLPVGAHGFVIEAFESPEVYEVEFDLAEGQVLATVQPEDFGVA
jgi:hypothetical protein